MEAPRELRGSGTAKGGREVVQGEEEEKEKEKEEEAVGDARIDKVGVVRYRVEAKRTRYSGRGLEGESS